MPSLSKVVLFIILNLSNKYFLLKVKFLLLPWLLIVKKKAIINITKFYIILVSNNNNKNRKFIKKTKIKVGKRFFNSILIVNKNIKIFIFEQNCFLI